MYSTIAAQMHKSGLCANGPTLINSVDTTPCCQETCRGGRTVHQTASNLQRLAVGCLPFHHTCYAFLRFCMSASKLHDYEYLFTIATIPERNTVLCGLPWVNRGHFCIGCASYRSNGWTDAATSRVLSEVGTPREGSLHWAEWSPSTVRCEVPALAWR